MSRNFTFDSLNTFDGLERKLSMSALAGTVSTVTATVDDDPTPPPDPEPDPGPYPGDDPPIVYPPLPPSGPVGPG
jgi:hypothetical protein